MQKLIQWLHGIAIPLVALSSLARMWGECSTIHPPPVFFFFFLEVEISSCTPIPLLMPGSVHSGSASWDDCGQCYSITAHHLILLQKTIFIRVSRRKKVLFQHKYTPDYLDQFSLFQQTFISSWLKVTSKHLQCRKHDPDILSILHNNVLLCQHVCMYSVLLCQCVCMYKHNIRVCYKLFKSNNQMQAVQAIHRQSAATKHKAMAHFHLY